MSFSDQRIHDIAGAIGIETGDLLDLFARGQSCAYQAGDYLFHESTPRQWMGIVEEGEIEVVAGVHGSTTRLATLTRGTAFGEGVMLDDLPHSASAVALTPAKVLLIPREAFDELRAAKPEVFYGRPCGSAPQHAVARCEPAIGRGRSGGGGDVAA
jgi:aspartate ammonia-lyase